MQEITNEKKRSVLIVEDDLINREILNAILSERYTVIQAENGKEGIEILENAECDISLILLDILMPVMNGYEFLETVSQAASLSGIPIIVTTSSATADDEIKCLENGAVDFVAKPYNPDVVLRRVESMIRLKEAYSVINRVEYDSITGLYSRDFFIMNAEKLLKECPDTQYDIFCCDIVSFKMLCERYGKIKSEALLTKLADLFQEIFSFDSVYGRMSDNNFILLTPHKAKEFYLEAAEGLRASVDSSTISNTELHMSVYPNVSHAQPVIALCNSAHAAIESVKYQYGKQIAVYNEAFRDKFIRRQNILGYMEAALKEKQFEVFYQPKHSLESGCTGGAEALVRWTHPELGFISPGEFIPLFEGCGFVTELDYYVADRVCSNLREWIDSGKPVVPVSWNVSRVDFGDERLAETIESIVDKYSIPHDLVHIEVTESAYMDNMEAFLSTVKKLHCAGFCIELDDFGAGYSSLTVLSELNVDILKLDMYFARNMELDRQKLILKHIFSIAQRLGMEVVAEGVETLEQSDAYLKMGCSYIQGYYYSKPLQKEQFEEYLTGRGVNNDDR